MGGDSTKMGGSSASGIDDCDDISEDRLGSWEGNDDDRYRRTFYDRRDSEDSSEDRLGRWEGDNPGGRGHGDGRTGGCRCRKHTRSKDVRPEPEPADEQRVSLASRLCVVAQFGLTLVILASLVHGLRARKSSQ